MAGAVPDDLDALTRLTQQANSKADMVKEKGSQMLGHRKEYEKLKTKLETLSDNMEHSVMVPMTSKAMMPASLVHTNEILVLLGDNYFIETSAKKAAAIAERRIKSCDKILDNLQKELELVEGWRKQASLLGKEKEDCVEITEDYDAKAEEDWKVKHAERVKKEKSEKNQDKSDESELWKRLEELEVQEALEREWENEDESEDDDSEDDDESSESELTSDNILSSDSEEETNVKDSEETQKVKRSVSWVEPCSEFRDSSALEPAKTISFTHSKEKDSTESYKSGDSEVPLNPSDLIHFACRHPKSILKPSDSEILVNRDNLSSENLKPFHPEIVPIDPEFNPVQNTIVEKDTSENVISEPVPERKVSKFKAARMKSKQT